MLNLSNNDFTERQNDVVLSKMSAMLEPLSWISQTLWNAKKQPPAHAATLLTISDRIERE